MTETPSSALNVALAYHHAWTRGDFEAAMTRLSDDIVCEAPSGRIEGTEGFRAFMQPFTEICTEATLFASYGDETTAVLMYDTKTIPVPHAPGAECLTVRDGRITHIRIIFNQAPFLAAEAAAVAGH